MSEIAKCPICNGTNIHQEYEIGDCNPETYVSYECWDCGDVAPTFKTKETWNQYAAAMDLAESLSSLDKCDAKTQHLWEQHVDMAEKRVLEVFNEREEI